MSLFLLTNNKSQAENAAATWHRLFMGSEVVDCGEGLYLALTDAYRRTKSFRRVQDDEKLFCFGTAFSERGFGEKVFPLNRLPDRIEAIQDQLMGHYAIVRTRGAHAEVFTDPVGMINIFWFPQADGVLVSNDLAAMATVTEGLSIDPHGVHEFILHEATIGADTIFAQFKRLRFAHALEIAEGKAREIALTPRVPEAMNFATYCERVDQYFAILARYPGVIAAELSAGYDTRMVAACAAVAIPGLRSITNENAEDGGVDAAIGKRLAALLKLPHSCVKRPKENYTESFESLLHATSVGRDAVRSRASLDITRLKFTDCDLVLGGYGGEIVRGKYCNWNGFREFARGYYGQNMQVARLGIETPFVDYSAEKLRTDYDATWISTPQQLCNWLYAADRMRIWGGVRVSMMSLYGDNLHPFMDWHLMGPLLTWNYEELKGAALQKRIIARFKPDTLSLPINPRPREISILGRLLGRLRYGRKKALSKKLSEPRVYAHFPRERITEDLQAASGLSMEILENQGKENFLSRFATIQMAWDLSDQRQLNNRLAG